jgi:anti-sigma regulatory factor (Ser/Thr protein kinase)
MPFVYTTNLSEVRALAEKEARASGLPEDRVVDFVIAVSEITANTVRHARSPGSMEIWQDRDEIVCEIRDNGVITNPQLAGSQPPPTDASGGHGLWLVHQVCDRVELHSDDQGTLP